MSVVSSTATKSTPRGGSTGPRQPWAAQALLNGVNTAYEVPSSLVTRPGCDGVRRPGAHQLDVVLGQGPGDLLVPAGPVGPVVGGDVHPLGADRARRLHDPADRVAPDDLEAVAAARALADRGVQRAQRVAEVQPARDAGRTPQRRVEDEQGEHVAVGRRLQERRVVAEPQIAPEPHHRRHHAHSVTRVRARGTRRLDRWARMQR